MSIAGTLTQPIFDLALRGVGSTPLVTLNRLLPEAGIEAIATCELPTIGRVS
jgi:hypothetical protein